MQMKFIVSCKFMEANEENIELNKHTTFTFKIQTK